jgi:hypothetical protein
VGKAARREGLTGADGLVASGGKTSQSGEEKLEREKLKKSEVEVQRPITWSCGLWRVLSTSTC